ncbi:hypothetical protein CEUSTIGMA_g5824.t1 [Chlamydomonas eustigma]|uniref:Uncharacterized protein n=1 Tax=Chlamydomonas eustigma TaxID=1157962 RepID=A0A250X663_9CHLO|nr:hypothetical protein CEUSTIGMA_g5824.t1 [Chlamydomonas eustigma]|eukprot:GAX78382.1 hypothetical protein CEUSTIGMA_g5824.t1 [Chlamydomonas eustigma]
MPKITKLTSANKRKGVSTSSLPAKSARKERVAPNDPRDDAFDREFLPPDNGRDFLAPAPYKPAKRVFGGASLLTAGFLYLNRGTRNKLEIDQLYKFSKFKNDKERSLVHLSAGPQAVFFSSTDNTNIPASIAPAGVTTYANPYIRDSAYMKKIEREVISKKLAKGDKVLLTDEDLKTILIKSSKFISYQAQHDPHYPASAHFMQYFELRDIVGVPKSCPVGVLGGLAQMRIFVTSLANTALVRGNSLLRAIRRDSLPRRTGMNVCYMI